MGLQAEELRAALMAAEEMARAEAARRAGMQDSSVQAELGPSPEEQAQALAQAQAQAQAQVEAQAEAEAQAQAQAQAQAHALALAQAEAQAEYAMKWMKTQAAEAAAAKAKAEADATAEAEAKVEFITQRAVMQWMRRHLAVALRTWRAELSRRANACANRSRRHASQGKQQSGAPQAFLNATPFKFKCYGP